MDQLYNNYINKYVVFTTIPIYYNRLSVFYLS